MKIDSKSREQEAKEAENWNPKAKKVRLRIQIPRTGSQGSRKLESKSEESVIKDLNPATGSQASENLKSKSKK